MEKTYTIAQIRKYIESQDSLSDVLYNLTEEKIDQANLYDQEYEDGMRQAEEDLNFD